MNDVFKTMVNHPIASIFVMGTFFNGVATIINAVKGEKVCPKLDIQINKPESTSVD